MTHDHDPLCPEYGRDYGECFSQSFSDAFCLCDIIAKVRADERKQATTAKATVHVCADNNCWCPKSLSRSELS